MRITIVLTLTLFGLMFLGSCGSVFAKENDIGVSQIHPASPLYFLKSVRENLEMKMAFTPRVKLLRQLEFATRRLREAKSLISINPELIPSTLERYSAHLNRLPEKDLQDQEVLTRIKESLDIHTDVLLEMHQQVSSPRAQIAIRAAVSRIAQRDDLSQDLKLPACEFLAKEASASALNKVEKEILVQRAKQCFQVKP